MAEARGEHRAGRLKDERSLRRRARHRNGRLWLLVIFLILRPTDFLLYKMAREEVIVAGTMIAFFWTTALLAAVCVRNSWARYWLIVGMPVLALIAILVSAISAERVPSVRVALLGAALAHLLATILLANSAAIKDLVSRAKD